MSEQEQCEHVLCGDCLMPLHDNLNGPCACGAWHRENEIPALEADLAALRQQLADAEAKVATSRDIITSCFTELEKAKTILRSIATSLDRRTDHERLAAISKAIGRSELIDRALSGLGKRTRDTLASPSRDTGSEEG